MSFDIIVLKPSNGDAECLTDVQEVASLGDTESVRALFEARFPDSTAGALFYGEEYALEVRLMNDPVGSAHLALRFGPAWTDSSHDQFIECLRELCRPFGFVAFVVSDNSRVAP